MRIISTSYSRTDKFDNPREWLEKISFYTGILDELAKQHEVISIERIDYKGEYQKNKVKYFFVKLKKPVVRFPFHIHRLLKGLNPDVVLVNGLIFPLQIIQLRLKLGWTARIILFHRSEKPFKGFKRYLQKIADKCIDAYLFTSLEFRHMWRSNINEKKIHEVIQASSFFYPMDQDVARNITGVQEGIIFLWVGNLIARKDPLTVVKAFLKFVRLQAGVKLYMIYQDAELLDEVKMLLDGDPLHRDSVILMGPVSHKQLQYWYNSAEFFILASHYEGSGIVVSEAMSCGCIPVVSEFISFKRMTGPGKCGLLFKPGSEQELLAALLKTREVDLEVERARVLEQFRKELSFEAITDKINKVIDSCKPS